MRRGIGGVRPEGRCERHRDGGEENTGADAEREGWCFLEVRGGGREVKRQIMSPLVVYASKIV